MRLTTSARRPAAMIIAIVASLVASVSALAQDGPQITLDLHYGSALELTALFDQSDVTDADLDRVYQLNGVQALIQQMARFDDRATEANFKTTLRAAVRGELDDAAVDPFQFRKVRQRIGGIRALVGRIQTDPEGLAAELARRIIDYSPAGLTMTAPVVIVVGGSSDGWTRDGTFHIALHYFDDDYEGMLLLMAHELYHVAQGEFMVGPEIPDDQPGLQRAAQMLLMTTAEGTASIVGDPLQVSHGGDYIAWFSDKYRRNLRRMRGNFALFEALLHWAHDDPEFDFGELYNMGFSGASDSRLYFVGYRIGKAIERHDGRAALVQLLQQPVSAILLRYDQISREAHDESMPRLGEATMALVRDLQGAGA